MGKIVVVYKSKYGHTKKYAEWLSEELNCHLYDASQTTTDMLLKYDTVIYGGGLYASGILGVNLITKNFDKLINKNIIIFTVGLADPNIKSQFNGILNKNFTDEMQKYISVFHLRGGINYKQLGFVHKAMMAALKAMVKSKKEGITEEDRMMLDTYGGKVDFTNKSTIEPIVSYVKSLSLASK